MKKQMVESTQENLNTTTNKFKTVEIHNKTLEDIIINATNALEEGLYVRIKLDFSKFIHIILSFIFFL